MHHCIMLPTSHRSILRCFISKVAFRSSTYRILSLSTIHQLSTSRVSRYSNLLTMTSPASKGQKTSSSSSSPYELLYWPALPGRGEHIRLCFEETNTPYKDTSNESKSGISSLLPLISPEAKGNDVSPPNFAPPILRHGDITISQTPNILLYIGPKLGLAGPEDEENAIYYINQLALTALDGLSNEPHDTHHPITINTFYEEQREEAKKRSKDFLNTRLPKFLGYFERVLQGEASKGGEWLYGGQLTYADLVLWQGLDGVGFAFPKAMEGLRKSGKYEKVFALAERVQSRERIKSYLASERRLKYGNGIYRHYPELDTTES